MCVCVTSKILYITCYINTHNSYKLYILYIHTQYSLKKAKNFNKYVFIIDIYSLIKFNLHNLCRQ